MKKRNKGPKEYLFVDGYNIINDWDILKEKAAISLEESRLELLDILSEYHHYSGIEIVIVFDAYGVKGNNGNIHEFKGITVVYTKENETADHYIEKTLDTIGKIKRVRVATSDRIEQQIILSRGGTRISARELEVEIYNEKKMIKRQREIGIQKNKLHLGRLDDRTLNKLHQWNKSGDKLD